MSFLRGRNVGLFGGSIRPVVPLPENGNRTVQQFLPQSGPLAMGQLIFQQTEKVGLVLPLYLGPVFLEKYRVAGVFSEHHAAAIGIGAAAEAVPAGVSFKKTADFLPGSELRIPGLIKGTIDGGAGAEGIVVQRDILEDNTLGSADCLGKKQAVLACGQVGPETQAGPEIEMVEGAPAGLVGLGEEPMIGLPAPAVDLAGSRCLALIDLAAVGQLSIVAGEQVIQTLAVIRFYPIVCVQKGQI